MKHKSKIESLLAVDSWLVAATVRADCYPPLACGPHSEGARASSVAPTMLDGMGYWRTSSSPTAMALAVQVGTSSSESEPSLACVASPFFGM